MILNQMRSSKGAEDKHFFEAVRKLCVSFKDGIESPATRIFSPLSVPGLWDTIGRYWYLFKPLTAVTAGRFYRFEHIVSYSSGKVAGKVKNLL